MNTYIFIIISALFACVQSIPDYSLWEESEVLPECEDVKGFCTSCQEQSICNIDGTETTSSICGDNEACIPNSGFSTCMPVSKVAGCGCNTNEFEVLPDPYSTSNFIICNEGTPNYASCDGDMEFSPDSQSCVEPTTTTTQTPTTTTTTVSCTLLQKLPNDCTSFRVCLGNGKLSEPQECSSAEVFVEELQSCEPYIPFTCSDKESNGYYTDRQDCSTYHLCINGEEVGSPNSCPGNEHFIEESQTCAENSECIPIEDCGICSDAVTRILIDCSRYYQCMKAPDRSTTNEFIPVLRNCPEGTFFDEASGFCKQEVEGCPST